MPDKPKTEALKIVDEHEQDYFRSINRSPHPYHHQHGDLPHSLHRLSVINGTGLTRLDSYSKESTPISDSGTEADDEHILKGLPAPKAKLHKGLRGVNEVLSGASTPLLSPTIVEEKPNASASKRHKSDHSANGVPLSSFAKRGRNLVRRITEAVILGSLGALVVSNPQVSPIAMAWQSELKNLCIIIASLVVLYPLRLARWAYWNRACKTWLPIRLSSSFDPAPLLYPPTITLLTSLLIATNNPDVVLPNIILSISSLPQQLVPKVEYEPNYDIIHWILSCLPLATASGMEKPHLLGMKTNGFPIEAAVLLYPLHRTICALLHYLTTTSLLTAELQLLSIALIDILILATSPQAEILKALLWGGGLGLLILCSPVIRWGIVLARVPKWRFRRSSAAAKRPIWKVLLRLLSFRRMQNSFRRSHYEEIHYDSTGSSDGEESLTSNSLARVSTLGPSLRLSPSNDLVRPPKPLDEDLDIQPLGRRHTLAAVDKGLHFQATHTASGRKRRSPSITIRPFLRLTPEQATVKKWAYAAYVYTCIILIILVGIRIFVQNHALQGNEPIGWALGYLFGNIPWFRFQVVNANLEKWVCLPGLNHDKVCNSGWVEHLRQNDFGPANTRLLLSGYWLSILTFGLLVVFQLKSTYEVDTRRKIFHFMMVGMFLPATFVDPAFAALALSLILAIFLILDLLRASQLPPLSKPLASFLAPYVDGRDFRGPVVISHIFLLIGCAIPLWLALGSLPRSGVNCLNGWEIPIREVSMVSGVICVGLGDAAASLIGRRYGRRKWLWGGGKSIEGSLAFALAVFAGLAIASTWLRVGGWPTNEGPLGAQAVLIGTAWKAGTCASVASLTEAVLTGGNDNVIVPVVLWTCVKSLGL